MAREGTTLATVLRDDQQELHEEWLAELRRTGAETDRRLSEAELRSQTAEFLDVLGRAVKQNSLVDLARPEWGAVRTFLDGISRSRVLQGFDSDQTAMFIFSLKKPLFARLRESLGNNADALAHESWNATELLDRLGLHTVKAYQRTREEIINRQQDELMELSTPVIKLWEGVLALPMIGTLDSARTQVVMESLLRRIVESGSEIAIIDITGVPTVDTVVAQHLLKTVTAIRLMGAECIISGIRPQIAQTIVHLGVDLSAVTTKANLADALAMALRASGFSIVRGRPAGGAAALAQQAGPSANGLGPSAGLRLGRGPAHAGSEG